MSMVVLAAGYGGPEVLTVADQPAGDPGPGEARIEVLAAGVNPADYKAYSGKWGSDPARLPLRVGAEAAGVVTAVEPGTDMPGGDAVGPFAPGDEVIAFRAPGAYAADLLVPVTALVRKPASLGWPEASGLMLTGVTAWHLLTATGVGDGDTVLIHGGAKGVGTMAVQLAVARGARVIATASPRRFAFLEGLGAIPVEYGPGLVSRVRAVAGEASAALDLAGTDEALDASLELVGDRQRIATIVASGRTAGEGIKALGNSPGADPGTQIRMAARSELARLAGDGTLRVFVTQTFPLAQAAAAHRTLMTGHTRGKIALIP